MFVQHLCEFPLILPSFSKMILSTGQSHFSSQISKTEAVPSHLFRMIRYFSVILTSFWIAANSSVPSFFWSFCIKKLEVSGSFALRISWYRYSRVSSFPSLFFRHTLIYFRCVPRSLHPDVLFGWHPKDDPYVWAYSAF